MVFSCFMFINNYKLNISKEAKQQNIYFYYEGINIKKFITKLMNDFSQ